MWFTACSEGVIFLPCQRVMRVGAAGMLRRAGEPGLSAGEAGCEAGSGSHRTHGPDAAWATRRVREPAVRQNRACAYLCAWCLVAKLRVTLGECHGHNETQTQVWSL